MADTKQRTCVDGEKGLHRDGEKPRLSDIMYWPLVLGAGDVWTLNNAPTEDYPDGKYPDIDGKPNFQAGIQTTKLLDSCQRHLAALHQGEDLDPESGKPHAHHLLCCLSMFEFMRNEKPEMDNRAGVKKEPGLFVMVSMNGSYPLRKCTSPCCDNDVWIDIEEAPYTHRCAFCDEPYRVIVGTRV